MIEQRFYEVARPQDRRPGPAAGRPQPDSALVFCNTRRTCSTWPRPGPAGFAVLALHGDLEQRDRDEVLVCFANRSCQVLVATDVAARGLDIKDLPLVVSHGLARPGRRTRTGSAAPAARARTAWRCRWWPEDRRRIIGIEEQLGKAALGASTVSATSRSRRRRRDHAGGGRRTPGQAAPG